MQHKQSKYLHLLQYPKKLIFYLVQTIQFENYLNPLQRGTSYPAVRNNDVLKNIAEMLFSPVFQELLKHSEVSEIDRNVQSFLA